MIRRLIGNYLAGEFHHYPPPCWSEPCSCCNSTSCILQNFWHLVQQTFHSSFRFTKNNKLVFAHFSIFLNIWNGTDPSRFTCTMLRRKHQALGITHCQECTLPLELRTARTSLITWKGDVRAKAPVPLLFALQTGIPRRLFKRRRAKFLHIIAQVQWVILTGPVRQRHLWGKLIIISESQIEYICVV